MRTIDSKQISLAIRVLCIEAAHKLPSGQLSLLKAAAKRETGLAANFFKLILKNADIAAKELYPLCQDTGSAVIFLDIGNEVFVKGDINKAINDGVRLGFKDGYLRKSIVSCPLFNRINTKDNTPAIVHINFIKGDRIKIKLLLKGGGAENASRIKMFTPSDGKDEIIDFIKEAVSNAGAKACPPLVLGIGIGGDFEQCAVMAKRALSRGSKNRNKLYSALEANILEEVNKLNIGPQGLGGKTTVLATFVEYAPCHMASLPVAVNICCHSHRVKGVVL